MLINLSNLSIHNKTEHKFHLPYAFVNKEASNFKVFEISSNIMFILYLCQIYDFYNLVASICI
jgi:hypothetical protein